MENQRQLMYILKIAEEHSISLAAKKLFISQPSLSQLLQGVEEKLGSALFDRSSLPLRPTYIGRLYLETARQILDLREQFYQKADDVLQLRRGRLMIGSSPARSTYLLAPFIARFQKQYPGIELVLRESTTLELEAMAQNGQTDVSISLLPVSETHFSYEALFEERLLLALPPEHSFCQMHHLSAGQCEAMPVVRLSDFRDMPFILMQSGQKLHNTLLKLCDASGFKPHIRLETRSMEAAQALAGAGLGATLLPETLLRASHPDQVPCYVLLDTKPVRTVIVVWRKDRYLSHAAREFIRQLKLFCRGNTFDVDCRSAGK